jgi:hypothetical protein
LTASPFSASSAAICVIALVRVAQILILWWNLVIHAFVFRYPISVSLTGKASRNVTSNSGKTLLQLFRREIISCFPVFLIHLFGDGF